MEEHRGMHPSCLVTRTRVSAHVWHNVWGADVVDVIIVSPVSFWYPMDLNPPVYMPVIECCMVSSGCRVGPGYVSVDFPAGQVSKI